MGARAPNSPPLALGGWRLDQLLAGDQAADAAFAAIEQRVAALEARRAELAGLVAADHLVAIWRSYEELVEAADRLAGYAALRFSADTQSPAALALRNRVQHELTVIENRVLFLRLWWQDQGDAQAARWLAELASRGLPDLVSYLTELRRLRRYKLDEKSEQIINLKDADGIGGVLTLYSLITNGLGFSLELPGEEGQPAQPRSLTRDQLMSHAYSPRPELRAAAYRELYRVYGEQAPVLAQMYCNRVRDWYNEQQRLRGYPSAISVRNVANDVSDAAIDTLLSVVRECAPVFRRYFALKAGWLGLPRLRRYDLYAPLGSSEQRVPYPDAVARVLSTLGGFHPEFERHARRVFDSGHIDSAPRPGKKGGAFCYTASPRLVPWVLVNYTGKLRDVATVAHELGHAVHSMLAEDHSILVQHASLPLAETASVFAEMLMTDQLLRAERDPLAQRELLAAAIDDIYATVLRQTYFVLFERAAHRAVLENRTADELSQLYLEQLAEQFGDTVEVAPEFAHEWVSIPHIYATPFYCYAYAFGQLLVLALYQRYREQGEAFKPGYLKLLAYGGAERPARALAEAGVEIEDPAFWRGGFAVIESMIDRLAALGDLPAS